MNTEVQWQSIQLHYVNIVLYLILYKCFLFYTIKQSFTKLCIIPSEFFRYVIYLLAQKTF